MEHEGNVGAYIAYRPETGLQILSGIDSYHPARAFRDFVPNIDGCETRNYQVSPAGGLGGSARRISEAFARVLSSTRTARRLIPADIKKSVTFRLQNSNQTSKNWRNIAKTTISCVSAPKADPSPASGARGGTSRPRGNSSTRADAWQKL